MNEVVSSTTRQIYHRNLVNIMIWLFDNHASYPKIFHSNFLKELKSNNRKDLNAKNSRGNHTTGRRILRKFCMDKLASIKKGCEVTYPIKLTNLTFTMVSRYIGSLRKVYTRGNQEDVDIRAGNASTSGICSSLTFLYTMCDVDKNKISQDLFTNLSKYKKGAKRMIATEKKNLGIKIVEGMMPLSFQAYQLLCKILFTSEKSEHIGALTFLTLEWNLISRAENVVNFQLDQIFFYHDALMFDFWEGEM